MNIREAARKAGGEEAVARIDRGQAMQFKLVSGVNAIIREMLEAATDDEEKLLVRTAVTEATSQLYAEAVAALTKCGTADRGQVTILAVRSLNGNLNKAFDDIDAEGVGDLIKAAAKKAAAKGE